MSTTNELFLEVMALAIRGQAWLDENNDGLFTVDEAVLAGETVNLVDLTADAQGVPYAQTTVGEDGRFTFDGVIPGTYRLTYALSGQTVSAEAGETTFAATEAGDTLMMDNLILTSGQTLETPRLGVKRYTSLGGRVWFDRNTELEGVPGAAVQWLAPDGSVGGETVTDEQGAWRFDGLMPGVYRISVVFPEGSVPVESGDARLTEGGAVSVLTTFDGHTGVSDPITVRMGEDQLGLDAGSVSPGSLGDLVWLDLDGDGLQSSDEGGIPGVTVHLWRGGEEVATTVTDQYGFFCFEELYPAAYTMTVDVTGVMPTVIRTDIPGIVSVMGGEGVTVPVTVSSGAHNYDADMGFIPMQEGQYPQGYGQGAAQIWQ